MKPKREQTEGKKGSQHTFIVDRKNPHHFLLSHQTSSSYVSTHKKKKKNSSKIFINFLPNKFFLLLTPTALERESAIYIPANNKRKKLTCETDGM
jgi:hypothetical protein